MGKYKWVRCPAGQGHPAPPDTMNPGFYTSRLFDLGINADGTLHNPNGYSEDLVRSTILASEEARRRRRSEAAKKAAKTLQQRRKSRVWQIAERIAKKQQTGPRRHCCVCGRALDDPPSVERGIGSECWQGVLDQLTAITGGVQ
jgi:hypothetical protein